ncbi:MAG: RNA polymerase sigma factor [Bacteroidota bacterium]
MVGATLHFTFCLYHQKHTNRELKYTDIHKEIVDACRQGDRAAQFKLYKLYSKAMYNICLRMLNNVSDAEDVLQNSFIDVFTKLHHFRGESTIGAWIKRITVNNCINFLKKRKLELVELGDKNHPMVNEPEFTFEEDLQNIELIKKAIPQLPDGYRVVFSLYMLEGYDHVEIAEIMDINVSTSKSQLNRAKKKLKSIILSDLQNDMTNARPA